MATKITLIGKPEMGKTTIKKVIFEGENPNTLMLFPLEATIGTKYSVYDFMDVKISLVDTPGQSMPILLEDEEKQIQIFENASAIIYIFDYAVWIAQPQDIINDIKKIFNIIQDRKFEAKIFLYLHKIDLINQKIRGKLQILKNQIINLLELPVELPIYFTSLHPDLIYSIYNAISDTISSFSSEATNLKALVNKVIKDLSRTACFVTNQNNSILIQAMTKDFDSSLNPHLHEKIYHLNQSSRDLTSKDTNLNVIDARSKILYISIENINCFNPNFKKAIFVSETLGKKDLITLMDKLKVELNQLFKLN
ncbi:MAG: GTPase [Promethearchaeota archaeon]